MAQETGSQILNYSGNAGLGLGGNADIPAIDPRADLNEINKVGRDIMMLNHANNVNLFQQKVRDRDELYKGLNDGKISTGIILEEDRPIIDEYKRKHYSAFEEMIKAGGVRNPQAALKYKKETQELNDAITQAQARYLGITGLKKEQSQKTLKSDQDSYGSHINKQLKKGFWGVVDPFQKSLDYDWEKQNDFNLRDAWVGDVSGTPTQTTDKLSTTTKDGKVTTTATQTTKPISGKQPATIGQVTIENGIPYNVQRGRVNYDKILQNSLDGANDEEMREQQSAHLRALETAPPNIQKQYFGRILQQARKYNEQNGFIADEEGNYPQGAINIERITEAFVPRDANDLSKGYNIGLLPHEFNALSSLASLNDYVKSDKTINKDAAQILQDQKELAEKVRHNKATEGVDWAKYNLDKNKFTETTKGTEESKNAALIFANGLFADLYEKASIKGSDGAAILTPDDIRKLTSDQLKFLGKEVLPERNEEGQVIESGGLQPLQLKENEIIQVNPNGEVLIMQNAKFNDKIKTYIGKWDNNRSTSVFNAARNVLNEENVKSGTKERNAYLPIDLRNRKAVIQTDISGGGKTKSGITQSGYNIKGKNYTKDDLNKLGYTDEQIEQAIKLGNIQTQ